MDKIWDELLHYETRDLVESFFKEKHNSEVNAWKIHEVTSNFIQAREYFESAKSAGFTVRPLLLYYGVLSLSKALILSMTPKLTEHTLKPSHGLDIKNWSDSIKNRNFENLQVGIGNGSFSELVSSTENMNLLRHTMNAVNWKSKLTIPPYGSTVTLKELYNYLPDLDKEYEKWTGSKIPFAVIESFMHQDKLEIVTVRPNFNDAGLVDLWFPPAYCQNRTVNNQGSNISVSHESNWSPNITQKWTGAFDIGDAAIVPVLNNDIGFNVLSAMFAISYTYGMMARYYPSVWISLRRVEKGDKIYPLIHASLNLIENKYPMVVLDFLKGSMVKPKNTGTSQ